MSSECFPFITVSGDAVLLMVEMLRVFVQGSNVSPFFKKKKSCAYCV